MANLGEGEELPKRPGGVARWRPGREPAEHLAGNLPAPAGADPTAPVDDRLRQQPAAGGAAGGPPQRAGRGGPGQGPPRLDRQGAPAPDRGRPQGGPAARAGRHLEPRAGHRHGRGRPRPPGRGAEQRRQRHPADRPLRPLGGRDLEGRDPPQVPGRPAGDGGRRRTDAGGRDRDHRHPHNPLDVLAQQVVAMCALQDWDVDELGRLVRRAYPFRDLGPRAFESTLDMLSGRYPSDEFAELRPRIVWDRVEGRLPRPGRRPAPRGDQRRHHPRSGALHGEPARRRPARRRARRGDGLRDPARRELRPRRQHLAGDGGDAVPGPGRAGAGRARQAGLLEGRLGEPPGRARACPGNHDPGAASGDSGGRREEVAGGRRLR